MITRPLKTPIAIAFHQLTLLAFFFAMRSCEYLKVSSGDRRTQPLRLRNIVFRKNNRIIPHDDPRIAAADTVTLTYEYQKKDIRDDAVTQSRTDHALLCPVKAAAAVVHRLRSIGATPDTFIFTYLNKKGQRFKNLTSNAALTLLRSFMKTVDKSYGLPAEDIGLHSLRASAAMAMYLNEVPVYTIMLLGRWSSDAFLRYIRKQVTEFSSNVAQKMIQNQVYHHVADANRDDPRTHNSMAATANLGMGSNGAAINRNVFSVWT